MGIGNKDKVLAENQGTDDDDQALQNPTANQSPADDIVEFATTKKYRDPARPNEILTYEQLMGMANRGRLFDKTQSELQKEQASRARAEENLAEANLRAMLAEQRAEQAMLNRRLQRIENPDDDLDPDDDTTQDTQNVDNRIYRQKIQPEFDKVTSELTELRKRQSDFEQREKEQANREVLRQRQETAMQAKMIVLQQEFPDIKENRLAEIVRQESLAAQLQVEAFRAQDNDDYNDKMASSNLYITTAAKLRAKAVIDQEKEVARKERQSLVETGSQTRPTLIVDKHNPSNRKESEDYVNVVLENARKNSELRSKAKDTL